MFKKTLSVLLSTAMLLTMLVCGFTAFAAEGDNTLRFNDDGTFKIMQLNDLQDTNNPMQKMIDFVGAVLDAEKPDLVVIAGDTLSDMFIGATSEKITEAITEIMAPFVQRGIPFAVTPGNHDYDLADVMSIEDQTNVFKSLSSCVIPDDGCDPGTYNLPILASEGDKVVANVYMMDTHNKSEEYGGYSGVYASQVDWYKAKSNELKAANGGEVVPSLVYQHIPVKEIYNFLDEVQWGEDTSNAIFSTNNNKWYVLDESMITSSEKLLSEAPCSEKPENVTGQYEAWLEQGDIIGAFFGHDHVNNFVGTTEDGIVMGYNSGAGFRSYGSGGNRSARIFVLNEDDVENYTTYCRTYNEIMNENISFCASDILTPALLTYLMRGINLIFGKIIGLVVK